MIAHLGMYDRPETAAANDRFWQAIRTNLGYGPDQLTRNVDPWQVWQSPDLLFSQTCGMPFRTRLHSQVQLVGTPDYQLSGCPPGHYNSVLVARKIRAGDTPRAFHGQRFAYNDALSQSGWAAAINHLRPMGIQPRYLLETGGHRLSAQAVAEDRADLAAIDAMTWQLILEHDAYATDLVEITRTEPTPTLPYVTANTRDAAEITAAVTKAIATLSDADRSTLHLHGLVAIPRADYLAVPTPIGPGLMVKQGQAESL